MTESLLLTNISWIAAPARFERGKPLYRINYPEADSILIEDGMISWIGDEADFPEQPDVKHVNIGGLGITPGLIDFHAHPVFAGTRENEFEMRTRGASYSEIAGAGGGILNSAGKLQKTDKKTLIERTLPYLDRALEYGTTTLEAKSGYGLETNSEIKMLQAIQGLDEKHPLDLIPTFLGAHEFPLEYRNNHDGYINLLINQMIPRVAEENLAVACDIFCEKGVYSLEESRTVLSAAQKHGLAIKLHADQLSPLGGTRLAVEMGALSADHIEYIDDESIELLANSNTAAGLLPVAAHFLRMEQDPPVRKMIEKGIVCALATDFNPGSAMCESMQMAMHLGVIRFRITAEEALWMATIGSARALDLDDRGSIEPGMLADLVVWRSENISMIPYHFGINQVEKVFKRGVLVVDKGRRIGAVSGAAE
ncbi:MAG: imidazolonepropionase [Candidatus Electryonea clarkiae]|nr:imidazolonepropionase [Candidatus Electryonea clarkiae]